MPFLEPVSLKKRKRKVIRRIKQTDNISKKGNRKKKSCNLVAKVVINLPFEERRVEGSQKHRRERVPKVESRGKKPSLNQLILSLESST